MWHGCPNLINEEEGALDDFDEDPEEYWKTCDCGGEFGLKHLVPVLSWMLNFFTYELV